MARATGQNPFSSKRDLYLLQNKAIHQARAQLGMSLDDCRYLAGQIGKKASISSLSLPQRWELIEILKSRGADVFNPVLTDQIVPKDLFNERLEYWNGRFPKRRPGFATNRQLAWIESVWILDFDDQRTEWLPGLRGFLFRQAKVSDPAFLKEGQVRSVMTPLLKKAKERQAVKSGMRKGRRRK